MLELATPNGEDNQLVGRESVLSRETLRSEGEAILLVLFHELKLKGNSPLRGTLPGDVFREMVISSSL